jgi:polar amino acid transport system substrate-binding protein
VIDEARACGVARPMRRMDGRGGIMRKATRHWPCLAVGAALWVLTASARGSEPEPLVMSFGAYNAAPYAIMGDGEVTGGILYDLRKHLARRLDRPVVMQRVPRKRQPYGFREGWLDLTCMVNAAWLDDPDTFLWSDVVRRERETFLAPRAQAPSIRDLDDLAGKTVGTVFGYVYDPRLTARFESGDIERDDGASLQQNLRKLKAGRIDVVLSKAINLRYHLADGLGLDAFAITPFVLSSHDIYCAVRETHPDAETVVAAINGLIADGTMREILSRYPERS